METFTNIKDFVNASSFHEKRLKSSKILDYSSIDEPILDIIIKFSELDYCFTLQSCYGHFLYNHQKDPNNLELLPRMERNVKVEYRIAYIVICIENSHLGLSLFDAFKEIPFIDKEYIQFGCADWFWERYSNSFALQVEPERHMRRDRLFVDYREALHIQEVRGYFFDKMRELLKRQKI